MPQSSELYKEVPKKITIDDFEKSRIMTNGNNHVPAGYFDSDSDDEIDRLYRAPAEPTARLMSPPDTLTAEDIRDEEKRRFLRDASMTAAQRSILDDSIFKTPNDTVLKNMSNFQSADPPTIARQLRHLHNRVKLLEDEIQTQQNRQIFLFGVLSLYVLSSGFRWMFR